MAVEAVRYALFALGFAPLAYYLVSIFAAGRFFGRRGDLPAESPSFTPPVSIVKPIYGLDRETYENYASFCAQDYPEYEILFCVSDEADPAVAVIHKIIQDFPDRAIRLLIGSEPLGVSDKVNKLCRMAREAKHETLIVSDSDVRVDVDYLREVVAPFQDARVGGVTCLYRGLTDNSLAADLEAIGNSTDFAAGVLIAWLFSEVNFMLGATMAVRKTVLAEIGGFESMVDYFSDDYELGNRIATNGHRVALIPHPVAIVYPRQALRDAFHHQLRWNLSIRFSRPAGHLGLIFTQGLPLAILAAICAPSIGWAAGVLAGYIILRRISAWKIGVAGMKDANLRNKMELLLLRDAFAFVVWVTSFFPRQVLWRGKEFQVRDKRLVPVENRQP
jgi:ceramide glucosyltransferase